MPNNYKQSGDRQQRSNNPNLSNETMPSNLELEEFKWKVDKACDMFRDDKGIENIENFLKNNPEILKDPTLQEAAKKRIGEHLRVVSIYEAQEIKKFMEFSDEDLRNDEEFVNAAKETICEYLRCWNVDGAQEIKNFMGFSDEDLKNNEEVVNAAKETICKCLRYGSIYGEQKIQVFMKFSDKDLRNNEEFVNAAKKGIGKCLCEGNAEGAQDIKDFMKISDEDFVNAAKEGIGEYLRCGNAEGAQNIKDFMKISDEDLRNNEEFVNAAKKGICKCLCEGNAEGAKKIKVLMGFSDEDLRNNEEVVNAAKERICGYWRYWWSIGAQDIKVLMGFSDEDLRNDKEVVNVAKETICECLREGRIKEAQDIKVFVGFSDEDLRNNEEVVNEVKNKIYECLRNGRIEEKQEIKEFMGFSDENLKKFVKEIKKEIGRCLSFGWIGYAQKIKDFMKFSYQEVKESLKENFPNFSKFLAKIQKDESIEINDIKDLKKYGITADFLKYLGEDLKRKVLIGAEHIKLYQEFPCLTLKDMEAGLQEKPPVDFLKLYENDKEEFYKQLFKYLKENKYNWQNEETIAGPFERGAEIFGYEKMFKYVGDSNLHDALYNFDNVIKVYKKSGVTEPAKFYNNILLQVANDKGFYEEGTSYNHFNTIISGISNRESIEDMLNKARNYTEFDELKELLEVLKTSEDVFSSWKNLNKFYNVKYFIDRKDVLDELKTLRESNEERDQKLCDYLMKLSFHPDSKIPIDRIMMFWKNPKEFFELEDANSGSLHEKKKPSNYLHIPNLDLTAEELRDAIVDGTLDKLAVFPPMEEIYAIRKIDLKEVSLQDALKIALGSRRKDIKGKASNPNRLFSEIRKICLDNNIDIGRLVNGGEEFKEDIEEKIWDALKRKDIGMGDQIEELTFKATVHLKSDPKAAMVGDDTACCMVFGSGKNNIYTCNPIVSIFSVQILKKREKTWRTIAQSVITENIDVKKKVPEVIGGLRSQDKLHEVISPDIVENSKKIMVCDNIEIAPNYREQDELIVSIYGKFFKSYQRQFSQEMRWDDSRIVVGQGYSKGTGGLREIDNTFIPTAPVAYSDNTRNKSYVIETNGAEAKETEELHKGVSIVSEVTPSDALLMAYLESKIYSDTSLIDGLHEVQNELIAMSINNSVKGRKNLSMMVTRDGKVVGYIMVYEGRKDNEPVIYIADMAVGENEEFSSAKLMKEFMRRYKEEYADNGRLLPIYAQFRENTSYRFVKDLERLNKLIGHVGLTAEFEEEGSYQQGEDTMHEGYIRFS